MAKSFTSYTHQWDNPKIDQRLKYICMASVDTIRGYTKEYQKAQRLGWRTFRVIDNIDNVSFAENEVLCPASKEAGKKTICEKCGLCNGLTNPKGKSVVIGLHGDGACSYKYKRYVKMMKAIKNHKKWQRDYKTESKKFRELCPC